MIKKVALAENFPAEKFLLRRVFAYISGILEKKSVPIDLTEYLFVLPTQEAGRLFREKAAVYFQQYGGVMQLTTILPEQLLFSTSNINHSDIQSLNDWCGILSKINPADFQSKILPDIEYTPETLLAPAEFFSKIRENILLESGLDTEDFIQTLPENSPLKQKLCDYLVTEKIYLDKLGKNIDKAQAIKNSITSPFDKIKNIRKIILIENSELKGGIKSILQKLSEKIEVIHLLNTTSDKLSNFDECGCPVTEKMLNVDLSLDIEKQLRTFSNPIREAEKIASLLEKNSLPDSIGIMDNELALTLTHLLERKNIEVYTPSVRFLNSFYWSRLFSLLLDLRKKRITYDTIYQIASDDAMTLFLQISDSTLLRSEIEKLQRKHLIQDFDTLEFFARQYNGTPTEDSNYSQTFQFCSALKNLIKNIQSVSKEAMPENLWNFFAEIAAFAPLENMDLQEAEVSLEALKNIIISLRDIHDEKLRMLIFKYKLANTPVAGSNPYKDEALNFSGFLDLIWYENPTLILGGISEEAFSSSAVEDAFFPENVRNSLNWSSAKKRFGADIHRFEQLLEQYPKEKFFITFSAASKNGELHTLPRLFFNVNDEKMLKNCRLLFNSELAEPMMEQQEIPPLKYSSHITDKMPSKISVTAFKNYIKCPYTFYLNNIQNCQDQGHELFELQANQNGTLLHNVMEIYGKSFEKEIPDIKHLTEYCLNEFERQFYACTGFAPNNLTLMQNEEIRKNLIAFAEYEYQYRQNLQNHKIIKTEQKIDIAFADLLARLPDNWRAEIPPPAQECADIHIVGKIDRIDSFYDDENNHIYRIIDYKSANKPESPSEVHLSSSVPSHLEPEMLFAGHNGRGREIYFSDMQLVIYSLFANFLPEKFNIEKDAVIQCGYYNLPLNIEKTAIEIFSELDDAMLKNGAKTLILLMNRIFAERCFWPPSLKYQYGIARKYLECDNINDFETAEVQNEK